MSLCVLYLQAVSCLAFLDTGAVLVSGGDDGLVHVWLLGELLDGSSNGAAAAHGRVQAMHTW